MENNQEARTGGKRQNFWKKNIYTLILSIKEQLWRVFKLNFDILSFLRLSNGTDPFSLFWFKGGVPWQDQLLIVRLSSQIQNMQF